ncbi:MAG: PH domain-containing protein [Candidatus Niyogibacteria bacterium]|nr:PH domain-containing protein [Candidatus Niyogibacteria bacterium]
MITLHPNETVVLSLHRHWIVVAQKMTLVAILLFGTLLVLVFLPAFQLDPTLLPLVFYLFVIYMLVVLLIAFVLWMDYYLDVWIVTTERIIDVEQIGMFRREVSEFPISNIQDVTVEVPNFVATLFHYGNIRIQTAGNQSFSARDIPNVERVKNVILEEVRKYRTKI